MEKGLLFFTLAVGCMWVILDDLFGQKKLSSLLVGVSPKFERKPVTEQLKDGLGVIVDGVEGVNNLIHGNEPREELTRKDLINNSKLTEQQKEFLKQQTGGDW